MNLLVSNYKLILESKIRSFSTSDTLEVYILINPEINHLKNDLFQDWTLYK